MSVALRGTETLRNALKGNAASNAASNAPSNAPEAAPTSSTASKPASDLAGDEYLNELDLVSRFQDIAIEIASRAQAQEGTYAAGQKADYFSINRQKWFTCNVIGPDGTGIKVNIEGQERTISRENMSAQLTQVPLLAEAYAPGQKARYFSTNNKYWFNCTVIGPDGHGGIKVKVVGQERTVKKEDLATHLRPLQALSPEQGKDLRESASRIISALDRHYPPPVEQASDANLQQMVHDLQEEVRRLKSGDPPDTDESNAAGTMPIVVYSLIIITWIVHTCVAYSSLTRDCWWVGKAQECDEAQTQFLAFIIAALLVFFVGLWMVRKKGWAGVERMVNMLMNFWVICLLAMRAKGTKEWLILLLALLPAFAVEFYYSFWRKEPDWRDRKKTSKEDWKQNNDGMIMYCDSLQTLAELAVCEPWGWSKVFLDVFLPIVVKGMEQNAKSSNKCKKASATTNRAGSAERRKLR